MDRLQIDNDAKLRVYLHRIPDSNGHPFFVGKLQFPGTINFERGVSFMIFCSEEGHEELQISPVDPQRRSKSKRSGIGYKPGGRITIDLQYFEDSNGEKVYTGEAQGPGSTDFTHGIFFTVFVSREGSEELQISRLDHSQIKRRKPLYEEDQDEFPESRIRDSVNPGY
jgi:hypothetical protein